MPNRKTCREGNGHRRARHTEEMWSYGSMSLQAAVYSQLLSAMVQQQVSGLTEQLPEMLQPEGSAPAGGAESSSDSTQVLLSLIENLVNTPSWLILAVVGIVLIYFGLYVTQGQRLRHRP